MADKARYDLSDCHEVDVGSACKVLRDAFFTHLIMGRGLWTGGNCRVPFE